MKFKLDENLPFDLAESLRTEGHDAHAVLEENLGGAADASVADMCKSEQRILITLDLDFASIKNYPPQDFHGIIVLRPGRQDRKSVETLVWRVLELLKNQPIERRLWIVDEQRTRVRGEE